MVYLLSIVRAGRLQMSVKRLCIRILKSVSRPRYGGHESLSQEKDIELTSSHIHWKCKNVHSVISIKLFRLCSVLDHHAFSLHD